MHVVVTSIFLRNHGALSRMAASLLVLGSSTVFALAEDSSPPRTHDAIDIPAKSSSIVVPVAISLADLQAEANKEIPETLYTIDENRNACVPAQSIDKCIIRKPFSHGCLQHLKAKLTPAIDCHLDGKVTRGNVTVGGAGTKLTLSMPIDISVTASGRGDLGKNVHKTANAKMMANVTASFDIDENWQPSANIDAKYTWTEPPQIEILGFKITFANKVDPKIRDIIAKSQQKLPGILADLKLKDLAEKYWRLGFTTLGVNGTPQVWVSTAPETVGYGGYKITDGAVNLSFMAGGKLSTSVGAKPDDPAPVPLRKLQKTLPAAGFDFSVPIAADYTTLHDQLASALKFGQQQSFDLKGYGQVKATINGVTLYQTEGRALAIGIDIEATPPGNLPPAKGTVWLTTRIKIDNAARTVAPDNLTVFGKGGNGPLDLLVSLVQLQPLNNALNSALKYDFSAEYDKLLADANGALKRQITPQLYMDGKVESITAESVNAGPDGLAAIVDAHGTASVHSGTMTK